MKLTKRQQMAFQKKYAEAFEMGVRSRDSEVAALNAMIENVRLLNILKPEIENIEYNKFSSKNAYSRVQV